MITTAPVILEICIDLDADNSFATAGDDISVYWTSLDLQRGIANPLDPRERVAAVGIVTLIVQNGDRRFSPGNTSSPYYNRLKPGREIRIRATDGVTYWPLYRGFIVDIQPDANLNGPQLATITCEDVLGRLQRHRITIPLQTEKRADELLRLIGSTAYKTPAASGAVTFNGDVGGAQTVTVGGQTYTFVATPSAPYEVKRDPLSDIPREAAINLAAAINAASGAGTLYGAGTVRHPSVAAEAVRGAGTVNDSGGGYSLGYTQTDIAMKIDLPAGETRTMDRVRIKIKKIGAPGDVVVSVVSPDPANNNYPSTTLVDVSAEGGFGAGDVATDYDWIEVQFLAPFTIRDGDYVVLSYGDGADINNCYSVDNSSSGSGYHKSYATGLWGSAVSPTIFVPGSVTLTAIAPGTWGNSIALSTTGNYLVASGATLAGGVDGPTQVPSLDYDTGVITFPFAGDRWRGDANAMTTLEDVVLSEWGYFWIAADGTPTFRNQQWWYRNTLAAAAMTIDNEQLDLKASLGMDGVYNEIVTTFYPRSTLASGTIIQAKGPILVPGQWGSARYNGTALPVINPNGGQLTVRLPAQDSAGNPIGVQSLVQPAVAGTHYTVYDTPSGAGYNYTYKNHITVSDVVNGSGVESTFTNDALGPLYVRGYSREGVGLRSYDAQQTILADEDAVAADGRLTLPVTLPLPATQSFTDELAQELLSTLHEPVFRLHRVMLSGYRVIGGVNPHSLDLGDVLDVTEDQTGLVHQRAVILGVSAQYTKRSDSSEAILTFDVLNLPAIAYAIFDEFLFDEAVFTL